ncbi:hypothetical protein J1N35_021720 [Gossypium stocksii]|uniref:Uncharacterized protein n=1 Tax=Gossypium stocksii TaxID=47602 RepID=A0A9D3VGD1_9ROSI|nr:hypothetical protein J1N35_021720 [Gossypium stocksii]
MRASMASMRRSGGRSKGGPFRFGASMPGESCLERRVCCGGTWVAADGRYGAAKQGARGFGWDVDALG